MKSFTQVLQTNSKYLTFVNLTFKMFQNIPCFGQGSAAIKIKPSVFCHLIKYHSLTHSLSKPVVLLALFYFHRFAWRTSEWKACQVSLLLDQDDPRQHKHVGLCGGGIQTREVYCVQITMELGMHRLKEGTCIGWL